MMIETTRKTTRRSLTLVSMLAIVVGIVFIQVLHLSIHWVWAAVGVQFLVFSLPAFVTLPADRRCFRLHGIISRPESLTGDRPWPGSC